MAQRWSRRPQGSNWGHFGAGDQLGRLNYLTEENTLQAAREIRVGKRFRGQRRRGAAFNTTASEARRSATTS